MEIRSSCSWQWRICLATLGNTPQLTTRPGLNLAAVNKTVARLILSVTTAWDSIRAMPTVFSELSSDFIRRRSSLAQAWGSLPCSESFKGTVDRFGGKERSRMEQLFILSWNEDFLPEAGRSWLTIGSSSWSKTIETTKRLRFGH